MHEVQEFTLQQLMVFSLLLSGASIIALVGGMWITHLVFSWLKKR